MTISGLYTYTANSIIRLGTKLENRQFQELAIACSIASVISIASTLICYQAYKLENNLSNVSIMAAVIAFATTSVVLTIFYQVLNETISSSPKL